MTDDCKTSEQPVEGQSLTEEKDPSSSATEKLKTILSQENYNITFKLKNGKQVSLAECGDPVGVPVMLFIGLAGTRHFVHVFDGIAKENNIRLICPDRPGTGLSDDVDHDDKTALKWTETVVEIADHLNIDKFGIAAQSCGAVYALACAMQIPNRLLGTIHLISPWVPLSTPGASRGLKFAQMMPRFLISASSSFIQSIPQAAMSMGSVNAMCSGWSEAETKSFHQDGIKEFFEVMLKLKRNENKAGHTNDMMMSLEKDHSHGFQYTEVNYPVHIFHGNKDGMVPIAAIQWLETAMINCKLSVRDLATHNLACDLGYVREVIFPSLKASMEIPA